jgi:hypothetical protein
MSSHREAPEISKDPVADSTDLYAFVSPNNPDNVTIIANYLPLQLPAGGPNFFEFGDDVLYEIHVANSGQPTADITYRFRFSTEVQNSGTFLYNTGPITAIDSPTFNRRQYYSVSRVEGGKETVLATQLPCPPCNIGPHSIPSYGPIAAQAIQALPSGERVFAGQRADGFYVDLGSVFDLADLRPFQKLFAFPPNGAAAAGVNALAGINVHSIAIEVPIAMLTSNGSRPTSVSDPTAVLGIWTSASRQKVRLIGAQPGQQMDTGPFVQVSRLGNPLVNEVIIPLGEKDRWNALPPSADSQFLGYVQHPELAGLLPVLYPGVFLNLAAYRGARADLVAVLLTGLPSGVVPGFQNFTGPAYADMLRLNVAVPPTPTSSASVLGLLGGDAAGFPNGRRVFDDVTTIELRAVAGVTLPLVDPSFTPDAAAGVIYDVTKDTSVASLQSIGETYLEDFPYLGLPWDGFDNPSATPMPNLGN